MEEKFEMIKYIYEIPYVMKKTLEGNENTIKKIIKKIHSGEYNRIVITGSGSSYNSSIISSHLFSMYSKIPTFILEPFELGFLENKLVDNKTIFIAVSRTVKSPRVVKALNEAANRSALTITISGDAESPLAKSANYLLYTQEGHEKSFPCTKSVITTISILMRFALEFAENDDKEAKNRIDTLKGLHHSLKEDLPKIEEDVISLISEFDSIESVAIAGSLSNYGVALEGEMKLQETALITTNGYSLDGLLHGGIGALNNKWLVLILSTSIDTAICKELITVTESLGAKNLVIGNTEIYSDKNKERLLKINAPDDPFISAVSFLIPLYLISYHWAISRGLNPDTPHYLPILMDVIHPLKKHASE